MGNPSEASQNGAKESKLVLKDFRIIVNLKSLVLNFANSKKFS